MKRASSESSSSSHGCCGRLIQRIVWTTICLCLLSLELVPSGSRAVHGYVLRPVPSIPASRSTATSKSTPLSHPISSPRRHLPLGKITTSNSRGGHGNYDAIRLFDSLSSSSSSAAASENNSSSGNAATTNTGNKIQKRLSVLWRFSRPHTIIGSALAIPALHLLAAPTYGTALTARSLTSMLYAMVPSLLMNLYITGLNQITDVEIDKINKPDLPIAAGDLSIKDATLTVVVSLVLSLALGGAIPALATEGLNTALGMSALLGTVYSLPPFRFKRFPLMAAFCIVAVRGSVINAGFFAHANAVAYGAASSSAAAGSVLRCLLNDPRCALSSLYFAVFGLVIALMKDVPDVKGDELSNIRTVSVRLGPKTVFKTMNRLLTGLFWGVGLAFFKGAATSTSASAAVRLGRALVGTAALLAGISVQKEAAPVDAENSREVYDYYMHLWKLFYLSYFFLPFAR
mmetsp:Transcript_27531/g.60590  ORF Transcript_27531/g.60590 Transcript_27531/m.60590 type:complete len:459 (+) Transcript_27531:185-1561(+)|eukprot:CAMPEP_0168176320 /NCGR_PEP_ID=MMETSP0139_2-20121125/7705_1 /TAXON_ID=44445 /ORGANISM="Pseudo-nitzschia australis, Strain 10249 10 AB" /LENGTH=458 /DNA_ID=CAMNT_0008094991 /DNA_START=186 /DNA_END=1562 /DNA_ORIENTATION=+